MHPLIERQKDAVGRLCREYPVRRLDVFGSATGTGFVPGESDVDLLVEFGPIPEGRYVDTFFNLREGLETVFGASVDLISRSAVRNPHFLAKVESQRELLFEA